MSSEQKLRDSMKVFSKMLQITAGFVQSSFTRHRDQSVVGCVRQVDSHGNEEGLWELMCFISALSDHATQRELAGGYRQAVHLYAAGMRIIESMHRRLCNLHTVT